MTCVFLQLVELTLEAFTGLDTVSTAQNMNLPHAETKFMIVDGTGSDTVVLTLNRHSTERVSCITYLGSPITDTGLTDKLVEVNILKAR